MTISHQVRLSFATAVCATIVGVLGWIAASGGLCQAQSKTNERLNLNDLPSIVSVPSVESGEPQPGKRVWWTVPGYEDWNVPVALYLPPQWSPKKTCPVIFEYPGNGGYRNALGDSSEGTVDGCKLGYGWSLGQDTIWVSLPFVDSKTRKHAVRWWGDVEATVQFCKAAVAAVGRSWSGDRERMVLCGFSRGALACSYIGLYDDEIASNWRALMPHSHYDGVRKWEYDSSDPAHAIERLRRFRDKPQFISHEVSIDATKKFLETNQLAHERLVWCPIPFPNHSPDWLLKELPESQQAREWLRKIME